ncbi:MAG: FMN-binding protein [Tissierellia bacterium]|nr:FMN-binding protein [Tissierellia bacterium]
MKFRKMNFIVLVVLIFVLSSCSMFGKTFQQGVYEGTGIGYHKDDKPIKISVTIDSEEKIRDIKILDHGESDAIGSQALKDLAKKALEINDLSDIKIDAVSNATKTTNGFLEALQDALEKARNK